MRRLVRIRQTARAGLLLNLVGVVLIIALVCTIVLGEVPTLALPCTFRL